MNFEVSGIYDSTAGVSEERLLTHLGSVLDVVYEYRSAFAACSVLLERALAFKSFPVSRRAIVQKQIDLFRRAAQGDHAQVVFDRSLTAYNGLDRFRSSHPDDLTVPDAADEPDASLDIRYAVAHATWELRNLRALGSYEIGVLDAHLSLKVPATAESLIRFAAAVIDQVTTVPTSSAFGVIRNSTDIDQKINLKAAGAPVTLTTPQYIDQIKEQSA